MLFSDKPLVFPCIFNDQDGKEVIRPTSYEVMKADNLKCEPSMCFSGIAEPGHAYYPKDTEYDGCFSRNPKKKPPFEYIFGFAPYDSVVSKKHGDYAERLEGNKINQKFLEYQIRQNDAHMFMMPCLMVDHILSDEDFDNAVDFHLSDYCFEYG